MNAEQKQRAQEARQEWVDYEWSGADSGSEFEVVEIANKMAAILQELIDAPDNAPPGAKWRLGDMAQKVRGSKWRGKVVGFYSTEATPIGYSVESAFEPGSVQVWPEAALIEWDGEK